MVFSLYTHKYNKGMLRRSVSGGFLLKSKRMLHTLLFVLCAFPIEGLHLPKSSLTKQQRRLSGSLRSQFITTKLPLLNGLMLTFLPFNSCLAVDGSYGILEGRTFSLFHPTLMAGLLLYAVNTGILGLQQRKLRITNEKLRELKETDSAEYKDLVEVRKELHRTSPRERHFQQGRCIALSLDLIMIQVLCCSESGSCRHCMEH